MRALLDRHDRTRAACRAQYRTHLAARAAAEVVSAELPALRAEVALLRRWVGAVVVQACTAPR